MSRSLTTPVTCSMRSARVDLPWSMWAMMQKLRMKAGSVDAGSRAFRALGDTRSFDGGWKDFRQFSHAAGERITARGVNSAEGRAQSGKVACWLAHRVHFP